jgi:hypothetical protein
MHLIDFFLLSLGLKQHDFEPRGKISTWRDFLRNERTTFCDNWWTVKGAKYRMFKSLYECTQYGMVSYNLTTGTFDETERGKKYKYFECFKVAFWKKQHPKAMENRYRHTLRNFWKKISPWISEIFALVRHKRSCDFQTNLTFFLQQMHTRYLYL